MKVAFLSKNKAVYESSFSGLASALIKQGHKVAALYNPGEEAPRDSRVSFLPSRWWNYELTPLRTFAPDRVIVFNGSFPWCSGATRTISQWYPTLHVELGWLPQAHYSYMDPQGPGGRSKLSQLTAPLHLRSQPKRSLLLKLVRARYRAKKVDIALPKDYLLVPLQLENDTSITYDSPWMKSMHSLLGFVRWHFSDVPIVVKPHPLDKQAYDLQGMVGVPSSVRFNDLVPGARAVLGINSTTLIEALVHNKPIATLGYNVASRKGVYLEPEVTMENPRSVLSMKPDEQRMQEVVCWLRTLQYKNVRPTKRTLDLIINPQFG